MKQDKTGIDLPILFQLKIAPIKLKVFSSCVLLINAVFLLQNFLEIPEYFGKFCFLRIISLLSLSDD